jgi:hypothetical protein
MRVDLLPRKEIEEQGKRISPAMGPDGEDLSLREKSRKAQPRRGFEDLG